MSSAFKSAKSLLGRAREHIAEAEAKIAAYNDQVPFAENFTEFDHETGGTIYKVKLLAELPDNLSLAVKDAMSNLRDALDHAVYGCAVALGASNPVKTAFPVDETSAQVKVKLATREFRDVPSEIHPLLISFQPYKAGNVLLWCLNRARNINTHRLVVPMAAYAPQTSFSARGGSIDSLKIINRWDPVRKEVETIRLGPGAFFDKFGCNVTFSVVFGDVDDIRGAPVLDSLYAMAAQVEHVIGEIETETNSVLRARTAPSITRLPRSGVLGHMAPFAQWVPPKPK